RTPRPPPYFPTRRSSDLDPWRPTLTNNCKMAAPPRLEMQDAKIYFRAFEPDDYRKINAWRRDEELYRLTGGNRYFVSSERDRQRSEEHTSELQSPYDLVC